MAEGKIGLDVDLDGMVQSLDEIGRKALPRAAAFTLNQAAFASQRALTAEVDKVFDRPVAFTRSAFVVIRAKPSDDFESMAAVVRAKDTQAWYLRLQIEGGERGPGDPGAGGTKDVMTTGIRETAAGGIARNLSKRLSHDLKREKEARASWAMTVLAHQRGEEIPEIGGKRRRKKLAESTAFEANNPAGMFFGSVGKLRGYWRRPSRKKGEPNRKPTLLLKVQPQAHYEARFEYNQVIEQAFAANTAREDFARELAKEIAYRTAKASK